MPVVIVVGLLILAGLYFGYLLRFRREVLEPSPETSASERRSGMTATIELTGEVVRPGDSGYEAAPADAGQEESDFAGSRARHRGQRDRPRRRISSVLLALLGPVALGVEAAPPVASWQVHPSRPSCLASVPGAMMRRRSSSNDSSVDTCDRALALVGHSAYP